MKGGRYTTVFTIAISLLLMWGCSDRPDNVASDSKMVKVMADLEMAQAYIQSRGHRDNMTDKRSQVLEYVLEKNGMTKADFDSTLSWYGYHIDKYDDLYAKVDKELARREARISGNSVEVLSNDLWPYSRHLSISPKSSTDNLYFDIPAEEIGKGDRLTWKFVLNNSNEGTVVFGVNYSDGNVAYLSAPSSTRKNEFTIQTDTAKRVKSIFGNLQLKNNRNIVGIDSLSLFSVPFDSTEYYRIFSMRKYGGPIRRSVPTVKKDSIKPDSI